MGMGNGEWENENALLGENHTKCQQDGIDGAGGSHGSPRIERAGQVDIGECLCEWCEKTNTGHLSRHDVIQGAIL